MEFRCRLGTPGGEIIEGVYIADSEARLRREFEEKGLFVLSLQRRGGWLPDVCHLAGSGRARSASRSFWSSTKSWRPSSRPACRWSSRSTSCGQRVSNPTFKGVLDSVHDKVKAGSALSDAFADHGSMFPAVYSASLLAGERSGNLEGVIRRYVAYEKVRRRVRRRTLSALIYPAILVAMMIVLVGIIVLQGGAGVLRRSTPTSAASCRSPRASSSASPTSSSANIWLILLLLVRRRRRRWSSWSRRPGQRARLDRLLLRLPWVGPAARKFATSQAARTLATLLGGGIPLVQALDIGGAAMSNRFIASELDVVRSSGCRKGRASRRRCAPAGVFPDVAVKMVEVGESTGALQEMLNSLAEFYDEEIETEVEPLHHADRAAAADRHGHRHRGGRAGALHAALRAELGGVSGG